jgi:syntaxin 5
MRGAGPPCACQAAPASPSVPAAGCDPAPRCATPLAGAGAGPSSSAKQTLQQQSEFTKQASHIGLSIHKVSAKLQKLAQLAKRTSMFDDPSTEIDELTGIIKQEIQTLKTSIAELERVSGRSLEENKQTMDHSHTVVDNLRARLKDTTLEFKDVLTLRTDNLKAHKHRRQLFSNAPEAGGGPGGRAGGWAPGPSRPQGARALG